MTAVDGVPCALLVGTTDEFPLCRQLPCTVLVEKTRFGRALPVLGVRGLTSEAGARRTANLVKCRIERCLVVSEW